MSVSTLYRLGGPDFLYTGLRLSVSWANREQSDMSLVEPVCIALDSDANVLSITDQTQQLSADKSTERTCHYHGPADVFQRSVSTTFSQVADGVAALYYGLYSPAGYDLSWLLDGAVGIEVFNPAGKLSTARPYAAHLTEFEYSEGLLVAGLTRSSQAEWRADHIEEPFSQACSPELLVGAAQQRYVALCAR